MKEGSKRIGITTLYSNGLNMNNNHIKVEELWFLRQYLLYIDNASHVDIFVNKPKREFEKSIYDVNFNDYDELILHNSWLENFIAGIMGHYGYTSFNKLLNFKGTIKYILTDPQLYYKEYGKLVKNRLNGSLKICSDENFGLITSDKCDYFIENISPKISYLFCGLNYEMYKNLYQNKPNWYDIKKSERCFLTEFISANQRYEFPINSFKDRKYDIVYFGTKKGSDRIKRLNYYFKNSDNLKKRWIGYDPNYSNCEFSEKYLHKRDLLNLIVDAFSTFIIGDLGHNHNMLQQRLFDSLNSNLVSFIDKDYVNEQIIQNKELREFLTIHDPEELQSKINMIKNDENLFNHIIKLQLDELKNYEYLKIKNN